jgi:hypothetical protein
MSLRFVGVLAGVAVLMMAAVAQAGGPLPVPEIDQGTAAGALTLLVGSLSILMAKCRRT